MFGSQALDVVFGLIFVYLVLSLLCSALNETLASVLAWRAKVLREGIANMLGGRDQAALVYGHPIVRSMTRKRGRVRTKIGGLHPRLQRLAEGRYPSYLPSQAFVTALLDHVESGAASVDEGIGALPDSQLKEVLESLHRRAAGNVRRLEVEVSNWYDDAMERVSGWYRRRVQVWLWIFAVVIAGVLNADTFLLARTLWNDSTVRDAVVIQAESVVGDGDEAGTSPEDIAAVAEKVDRLPELAIPLGWTTRDGDPREVPDDWRWLTKLAGLVATAAALTFGAPFWFDLLRRVGGVRSAGRRPRRESNDGGDGGENGDGDAEDREVEAR